MQQSLSIQCFDSLSLRKLQVGNVEILTSILGMENCAASHLPVEIMPNAGVQAVLCHGIAGSVSFVVSSQAKYPGVRIIISALGLYLGRGTLEARKVLLDCFSASHGVCTAL